MSKLKVQKNKSYKFIYGLTFVGIVLLAISIIDIKTLDNFGASSFSNVKIPKNKSFQDGNEKIHMPSKLTWGRDF
jgi:hypothetical protein